MHRSFLFVFFVFWSQTSLASNIEIPQSECVQLAGDVSVVAFSTNGNGLLYRPHDLHKGTGFQYIDRVRNDIQSSLVSLCKSDTFVSLESFKEKFHEVCGSNCQKHKGMVKRSKRIDSDTTCLFICNKTHKNLDLVSFGHRLNKCVATRKASDPQATSSVQ